MNENDITAFDNAIGKVFRHKRLFNFLISPVSSENGTVKCHAGRNIYKDIPMDYFKRDWFVDKTIIYSELLDKVAVLPDGTPFTTIYDMFYEIDDGFSHSYIHFNDDMHEKMHRFPMWVLTTCTKEERNNIINPYTMIMPVLDDMTDIIQAELDIMNTLRLENEFIQIDDFQGFEFGLIKFLEKKYLREI